MNYMGFFQNIRKNAYFLLHIGEYLNSIHFLRKRSNILHKIAPYSWLDDRYWLEFYFCKKMGYRLNLNNPLTLNAKLNWMKLYDRNPLYSIISDKYECREYIREKLGEEFLKPIIGVYNKPEEINWNILPAQFVIKATHGSGWNIICQDKDQLNIDNTIKQLSIWLKQNYYEKVREWQYKKIKPRLLIEPLLENSDSYGLIEYQFYVFNGVLNFIQIDIDCNRNHSRLFVDQNWEREPFTIVRYPIAQQIIKKPDYFDEYIKKVESLAQSIPFCRVDTHILNDRLMVSEMTLMPAGGFMKFNPQEFDAKLGQLLYIKK